MARQVDITIGPDGRAVASRGAAGPIEELKVVPRVKPRVRFIQPESRIVTLMKMA